MLAEQQTEWIINNNLINKGWFIEGKSKNVYFQKPPYIEHQEKLKNKRPDYILYESGTNRPIAIIEAKKGGSKLEAALQQGIEYAKALEAPLVFAMNGAYCETCFVPNGKQLVLNGNTVRELLREWEAQKFLEEYTNEIYTIPKNIIISRNDLIKTFKNLNDTLRSEGLRAGLERFSEFSNILFLKLLSENNPKSWWHRIKEQYDDDIIGYINGYVISEIKNQYGGNVFTPLNIKNPKTLRHIIDCLDPLTLSTIDSDVKGDAFEYFLENTTSTENDLGEYFTPRNIVKTVINLVDPKFKEKIYDPFCGTGGFLTAAFHYIKENTIIEKGELKKFKGDTFFGSEITTTARIAKMNMILHGDGHSGIDQVDSIMHPVDSKFDVVITNMPFSQTITRKIAVGGGKYKTENHISPLYYNGLAKNNGDAACVLHCLRALKPGGRMALIVPEGFLFRKDTAKVREFLLTHSRLQSLISLPQGTFLPYTGVKTSVLYFTDAHKINEQKEYWFYEVKNIGVTLNNKKQQVEGINDLDKISASDIKKADKFEALKTSMLENGWELVDLENVINNDWNLVGNGYRKKIACREDIKNLKDLLTQGLIKGKKGNLITKNTALKGNIPVIAGGKTIPYYHNCSNYEGNVITISASGAAGFVWYHHYPIWASDCNVIYSTNEDIIITKYIFYVLKAQQENIYQKQQGTSQPHIYLKDLYNVQIPLPPLEQQQKIVEELDSYQKIIDGAKKIVDTWKPYIEVSKEWDDEKLENICSLIQRGKQPIYGKSKVQVIKSGQARGFFEFDFKSPHFVSDEFKIDYRKLQRDDVLINSTGTGTAGRVTYFDLPGDFLVDGHITILRPITNKIISKYLLYALICTYGFKRLEQMAKGSSGKIELDVHTIKNITIPLPPIHIQQEIVASLEQERQFIEAQKELIKLFEKKMQDKLNSLWTSDNQEITPQEEGLSLFSL